MTLKNNIAKNQPQCCKGPCTNEGELKYYSNPKLAPFCGESCIKPSDFLKFKLFEPGLKLATSDNMCDTLGYSEYKETEIHGFGPIKIAVDLYKKPPSPANGPIKNTEIYLQ